MGRKPGDMDKSDYDADEDGTVDNAAKLEGSSLAEVQDHTPKSHEHTESDVTDLAHNATHIAGKEVNDAAIGDQKTLAYDDGSGKIIYITPAPSGAAINSIQMGTILIEDEALTNTATIDSVDTANAVVFSLGIAASSSNIWLALAMVTLTNATTVTASRGGGLNTYSTTISFCVIEFSSGIEGVQNADIAISAAETSHDATITEVDTDKTLLLPRGFKDDSLGTDWGQVVPYLELVDSTTVRATQKESSEEITCGFALIEFA